MRASELEREDVAEGRRRWKRGQSSLDPSRLVFIDESAAKTNMTRLRGRSARGMRVYGSAPCGRWQTTTMIGSIRLDGTCETMTIEGSTTTEVFRAYVREVLLPVLRPGDVVIMDNLSSHKNRETLEIIEKAGAEVRFLPPYSPDLNPIELMWSKVKNLLRKYEARDPQALLEAVGKALQKITASNAMGWFTHCGYSFI